MKSLKGRGGMIGKGMNENVLNVWTKTMQRSAEVITLILHLYVILFLEIINQIFSAATTKWLNCLTELKLLV